MIKIGKSKQPEINIGMVGHIDHGKTTLTEALSGIWTDTHSEEIKRGITIRLGYADATFYKCPNCDEPQCYTTEKKCPIDGSKTEFLRMVSFVDAPGHETLMATMLSGAALMDGAILVIAANEPCPQPQTKEHLVALNIIGVKNTVVVQNKIDLVPEEQALENYREIKSFVSQNLGEDVPIIPVAAQHHANIDILIKSIEEYLPSPKRDEKKPWKMHIARSFDVNKPGTRPENLLGGVIGGSLSQGKVGIGDEIEIRPGERKKGDEGYGSIFTDIESIMCGGRKIKVASPGGLLGIATGLDSTLTKADGLAGKVAGKPDTLPPVLNGITLETYLLERVVGTKEEREVVPIKKGELLMLNLGTSTTLGTVTSVKGSLIELLLRLPICGQINDRVAISRKIGERWRLIGHGVLC